MSTPERQQDPGEHGYGGVKQEPDAQPDGTDEHPLDDPDDDSRRDEPRREQPDRA